MIRISEDVLEKFPGLSVRGLSFEGVEIERSSENLRNFKEKIFGEMRERMRLDDLKNDPLIRAYRDFFWKMGIDPTKTRPSSEALLRRILQRGSLPEINTLVDTYNLVSAVSKIPIAGFDMDEIEGELLIRFSKPGERFLGISMEKERELSGKEIVISDSRNVIAIYPYRDSELTKIRDETENVLFIICGAPGVGEENLERCENLLKEWIQEFCGGKVSGGFKAP
ncbi:MAG: hypothetical protein PWR13_611 [Archaeoglobi archaeon]|nr:hypothetical protein [Candidatus Mnemosynella bozhongmuii]MDK2781583.1 hypothetical protein [Archaeoglobi archaeon]